ncbi:MAG: endo alpha-1,4 polygalactosaminidase [Chloroflexota bacterium]
MHKRWIALLALVLMGLSFDSCRSDEQIETEAEAISLEVINSSETSPLTEGNWWQPAPGTSWQWQLDNPVEIIAGVQMYDIDLFENDAATVEALHASGAMVVCYISMGSWEDWRSDSDLFPAEVIGKAYTGWQGEKWLDIRRIDLLAPILTARLDLCAEKGFDGVEPDNIDGYRNNTGFNLSYTDQIRFNRWLAGEAHARGLSIGIKNDSDQVDDLLEYYDWALTEDCYAGNWCEAMLPFASAGKAVFMAEYTDMQVSLEDFCPLAARLEYNAILKERDLTFWRQACP